MHRKLKPDIPLDGAFPFPGTQPKEVITPTGGLNGKQSLFEGPFIICNAGCDGGIFPEFPSLAFKG